MATTSRWRSRDPTSARRNAAGSNRSTQPSMAASAFATDNPPQPAASAAIAASTFAQASGSWTRRVRATIADTRRYEITPVPNTSATRGSRSRKATRHHQLMRRHPRRHVLRRGHLRSHRIPIVHAPLLTLGRPISSPPRLQHVGRRGQPPRTRRVLHPRPRRPPHRHQMRPPATANKRFEHKFDNIQPNRPTTDERITPAWGRIRAWG